MTPLDILAIIREHSPICATALAVKAGASIGEVYSAIASLEAEGCIEMGSKRGWSEKARPVPIPPVCLANLRIRVPRELPAVPPVPPITGNQEIRRLLPSMAGTYRAIA